MIYYFTPYSIEKKLLTAYDQYMDLIEDADWACFMDGDIMFLRSNFGHDIRDYVNAYPDTGMFTCYASRCHYQLQIRKGTDKMQDSIMYHKNQADKIHDEFHLQLKPIDRKVAGHLMLIKKATWLKIRKRVFETAANELILGVDTQISLALLEKGYSIQLMRGIYVLHYLRLKEGFKYKEHLL